MAGIQNKSKHFNTQAEYDNFYNKLRRYANSQASSLFSDVVLREDVVTKAMDRVVDWLITGQSVHSLDAFTKTIIKNSLKTSARLRKLESVGHGDERIYQIIERRRGRPPNK